MGRSVLVSVGLCLTLPLGSCGTSGDSNADAIDAGKDGGRVGVQVSALGEAPEANCVWAQGPVADYWFCPTARSFQSARDKCTTVGLDLPAITSATTNTFLQGQITGTSWIGASDPSPEGAWRWVATNSLFWSGDEGGSAVGGAYTRWSLFQPNNYFNQDCATIAKSDGRWDDQVCSGSYKYICQSFVDQCMEAVFEIRGASVADRDG